MRRGVLVLAILATVAAGCGSMRGPQRLIVDFQVRGVEAALGTEFEGLLLGGEGTAVCVGKESVQVTTFPDAGAAIAAANTVNKDDPSNIGNAVVEWIGPPRFWLRDESIVLYVGGDAKVDAALRAILGQPFAEQPGFLGRGVPANLQRDCERA